MGADKNIKIVDLLAAVESLKILSEAKFKFPTAQKLVRLIRLIQPRVDEYNEFRSSLFKRLGTPVDGKPDHWLVSAENQTEFNTLLTERLERVVPILEKDKLSVDDLTNLELTGNNLLSLACILVDLE